MGGSVGGLLSFGPPGCVIDDLVVDGEALVEVLLHLPALAARAFPEQDRIARLALDFRRGEGRSGDRRFVVDIMARGRIPWP